MDYYILRDQLFKYKINQDEKVEKRQSFESGEERKDFRVRIRVLPRIRIKGKDKKTR
jgi:hypothetical protein